MKTRWLASLVLVVLSCFGVGFAQGDDPDARDTAQGVGSSAVSSQTVHAGVPSRKFDLGEFVATSIDEELHYIKAEVSIEYQGISSEPLEKLKEKLRDDVNTLLMKQSINTVKQKYVDHTLHREILKKLEDTLNQRVPGQIQLKEVWIPLFLLN